MLSYAGMKRSSLQIRKTILRLLMKYSQLTLRQLESKANTASKTILLHVEDLESLGFIKTAHYKSHPKNHKPYTVCKITPNGFKYMRGK